LGKMSFHCYAFIALIAFLIYREYNYRKEFFDTLTLNQVVNSFCENVCRLPTIEQIIILPAYIVFMWIFSYIVPGYYHRGVPLNDKTEVDWKINGLPLFIFTLGTYIICVKFNIFKGTILYDNFLPLLIQANIISLLLSIILWVKGTLARKGTGNFVHDFVMGTELNPSILGIYIKYFWLKPSMIGWVLLNLSFLYKHIEIFGTPQTTMILYQIFSFIYIFDYFLFEEYMTSTWDIIAEHFGLMLVWGDFVFIPFVFSLQNWFLIDDNTYLEFWQIVGIVLVFLIGFFIFRGSNKQKHDFKHHPEKLIWGSIPETIDGKLLVSGFWGLSRHPNYMGDIILGASYSLPCLFKSVIPWVYILYLSLLLVKRELRDEARCKAKYTHTWDKYTRRVPYRIFPHIY